MIRAIDHVNIASPDLKATRDFFVEVLGFEDGWRPAAPGFPGHWLYLGGRPVIHLQEAKEPVAPSRASAINHVAFEAEDLDAIAAKLQARGIAYRTRDVPEMQFRQIFIDDMTGVFVELNKRG
jgi:catechol 2,3-dioxygenase-like lactoylglutathione lyase family enzyme